MKVVDNAIALRIVYLLQKPFRDWPAYKQGIIDDDGTILKRKTDSPDWTMLHRLVARLKLMLGKLPGGSTRAASLLAAYLLVRESINSNDCVITEVKSFKEYMKLKEDGEAVPANNTNNVAGIKGEPPVRLRKKKHVQKSVIAVQGTQGRGIITQP